MGIAINGKTVAGFAINGKKVAGMALNGQVIWRALSLPPIGKTLNEYTWGEISMISSAGRAPDYFAVDDRKAVHLQGTVGSIDLDDTYYVYILGFNHNGAQNCIDFGTFKTASTGGKDICLQGETMNQLNANAGGWKNCKMRNVFLGTTNVANGNATATTATSPAANTLMAALPADLRAVMKPMEVWTDNVGNSNEDSAVTMTVDYLPLLAEFEVLGYRDYANISEQNHQTQYQYYQLGNSAVKRKHDSVKTETPWWERSPGYGSQTKFCDVDEYGDGNYSNAKYLLGLAPIFRV